MIVQNSDKYNIDLNVKHQTIYGYTGLHYACVNGHLQVIFLEAVVVLRVIHAIKM